MAALFDMQKLIESSVCFDSVIGDISASNGKSPNSLFMHRMYSVFEYNNEYYLANLAIEESCATDRDDKFRDTFNKLYSFRDIKITPMKPGFHTRFSEQTVRSGASIGVTEISIPELYKLVKTCDRKFSFQIPDVNLLLKFSISISTDFSLCYNTICLTGFQILFYMSNLL